MEADFILDELEITATPFALCELNGACDLGLGQLPTATLHFVLAGSGEVTLPGQAAIPVTRGDLILVPALNRHVLRSFGEPGPETPDCQADKLGLAHFIHQSDEDTAGKLVALCATFTLTLRRMRNLVDLIRAPIIERHAEMTTLGLPMEQMLREISSPGPGSRAMINALLLQCMIQLLRARMQAKDPALGWMDGLRDARLWPVIRDMLDHPGEGHSVESLAAQAGMSRSGFAQRFQDAYGRGPMEMLREIRMRHAAQLLAESDLPVKRISEMSGFRSRSAFSRTFEALLGKPPKLFRSESRIPPG